jgi:demethylspheroidene O-methyltransferase
MWRALGRAIRDWRNARLVDPIFQRRLAAFPLTRPIVRREAAALFDVVAGFVYTQTLLACVRLGVLQALRAGPRDEAALYATAIQGVEPITREDFALLLRAGAALDLFERDDKNLWALGLRGAALLGNPGVLAMIEHHAVLYRDLVDPLAMLRAAPGTTALANYWPYAAAAAPGSLERPAATAYTALMSASQSLVADEILDAWPMRGRRKLLDVGGGDGTFLRAAGGRHSALQLMLFDLPAVIAIARERFMAAGMSARAEFFGGDFTVDMLPRGADVVSFVRVLHDHDDATVARLLLAAHDALPRGGELLIAEPLADTAGARRMGDAYFGLYLRAMGRGRPRRREELARMLRVAGFGPPREWPTRVPLQVRVLTAERR